MEGESTVSELNMTQDYSKRVGERIRSIRRQKRLSLQEVEAASNQEFKASVLGAYERGERVHDAMAARGFNGTMPTFSEAGTTRNDWLLAAAPTVAAAVGLTIVGLT